MNFGRQFECNRLWTLCLCEKWGIVAGGFMMQEVVVCVAMVAGRLIDSVLYILCDEHIVYDERE